jgi:hypothetical protein
MLASDRLKWTLAGSDCFVTGLIWTHMILKFPASSPTTRRRGRIRANDRMMTYCLPNCEVVQSEGTIQKKRCFQKLTHKKPVVTLVCENGVSHRLSEYIDWIVDLMSSRWRFSCSLRLNSQAFSDCHRKHLKCRIHRGEMFRHLRQRRNRDETHSRALHS